MSASLPMQDTNVTPTDAARRLTLVLYALYALTPFTLFSGLIAVLVNHIKYADARKTLYGSHFRWQMRTFWWGIFWVLFIGAGVALSWATDSSWKHVVTAASVLLLLADGLWVVYRVIRGAVACIDGKRMPV